MVKVEMPALDGRNPLGFLASLGLLSALSMANVSPLRLSFSRASAAAELYSPLASIDEAVGRLRDLVTQQPDAAVVGLDPGFPPRAGRSGGDPLRQSRGEFRQLLEEVRSLDARAASDWMPCLFTDLAVNREGRVHSTPFCAPSGQQNMRTFFEKPLSAVRADPSLLQEALVSWRRVDGFTGEYLDHRVINSAADDPGGRSVERGVPGATWLATMAIPFLRVAGDRNRIEATLWYRVGRRLVMIWPLWDRPLDMTAIRVMIEHPCLSPLDDRPAVDGRVWPALGIFAVYGAERQEIPGRKSAGVLAPRLVDVRSG
jgi:CRISPR-associated endonuclease/helicase Cas3